LNTFNSFESIHVIWSRHLYTCNRFISRAFEHLPSHRREKAERLSAAVEINTSVWNATNTFRVGLYSRARCHGRPTRVSCTRIIITYTSAWKEKKGVAPPHTRPRGSRDLVRKRHSRVRRVSSVREGCPINKVHENVPNTEKWIYRFKISTRFPSEYSPVTAFTTSTSCSFRKQSVWFFFFSKPAFPPSRLSGITNPRLLQWAGVRRSFRRNEHDSNVRGVSPHAFVFVVHKPFERFRFLVDNVTRNIGLWEIEPCDFLRNEEDVISAVTEYSDGKNAYTLNGDFVEKSMAICLIYRIEMFKRSIHFSVHSSTLFMYVN